MFTLAEIIDWTGGKIANLSDLPPGTVEAVRVTRPWTLGASGPSDVAFFFSRSFEGELPTAAPGVLITAQPFIKPMAAAGLPLWKRSVVLVCEDPYFAMAMLSEKFAKGGSSVAHLAKIHEITSEIHASAVVDPSAHVAAGVQIGAHCVIERGASIGSGSVLYPGCYVGPGARIGENTVLFPGVVIYETSEIGNRVRIHASTVIGADGFGYAPKRDGARVIGHQKIYHLGKVVIEDDVEIGAGTSIDRGTFGETRIERQAKLDNHVHVGHNARVGQGAIICGGVCLAGNAQIGRFVYVGGITGIDNHVRVGDGARVGAVSAITKDIPPGGTGVGVPQRDHREHFKAHALLSRLLEERSERRKQKTSQAGQEEGGDK